MKTNNKPMRVLLVDDNPGDLRLMLEVLQGNPMIKSIESALGGEETLNLLEHHLRESPRLLPDLIILDIKMPSMGGLEVLARIKTDDLLKRIPVVMLTSSQDDRDVAMAYEQHANCYITKPVELEQYVDVVKAIEAFWIDMAVLPN